MSKAYTYGGPSLGAFDTRHEAAGWAAIVGRDASGNIRSPFEGPKEAIRHIGAIPTAICGYCGEVFDYERELDEHKPCPHYNPPSTPEKSNPIEAARMTRYNL